MKEEIISECRQKMTKTIDSLKKDFTPFWTVSV
jgi:ribosome recycling factor